MLHNTHSMCCGCCRCIKVLSQLIKNEWTAVTHTYKTCEWALRSRPPTVTREQQHIWDYRCQGIYQKQMIRSQDDTQFHPTPRFADQKHVGWFLLPHPPPQTSSVLHSDPNRIWETLLSSYKAHTAFSSNTYPHVTVYSSVCQQLLVRRGYWKYMYSLGRVIWGIRAGKGRIRRCMYKER